MTKFPYLEPVLVIDISAGPSFAEPPFPAFTVPPTDIPRPNSCPGLRRQDRVPVPSLDRRDHSAYRNFHGTSAVVEDPSLDDMRQSDHSFGPSCARLCLSNNRPWVDHSIANDDDEHSPRPSHYSGKTCLWYLGLRSAWLPSCPLTHSQNPSRRMSPNPDRLNHVVRAIFDATKPGDHRLLSTNEEQTREQMRSGIETITIEAVPGSSLREKAGDNPSTQLKTGSSRGREAIPSSTTSNSVDQQRSATSRAVSPMTRRSTARWVHLTLTKGRSTCLKVISLLNIICG